MRKMIHCLAVPLAAAILATPAAAEEVDPQPGEEIQQQLAVAIEKQNAVVDEHNALIRAIKRNEELVELDRAIASAQEELAAAEADNDQLTAARESEQQVRKAVQQAIEERLKEHPEGGKLLAQIDSLQAKQIEQQWQIQLAKFQLEHPLSPVSRALAGDQALAKAKQMIAESESKEERFVAQAAYDALRQGRVAELEEGQRLQAMIEDASALAQRLKESAVAIEERLSPIRRSIEKEESKRIADARETVAAALNTDRIKGLRQQVNDRINAYNARVKQLIAENDEAVRLRKEYDELAAQIKALRSQLAEAKE